MSSVKGDLKKINIQNFRSLQDIKISLNKINLIVGRNDNGKSNLIRAIISYLDHGVKFTDEDRASFIIKRRSSTVEKEQIRIIGELSISSTEGESIIKVEKQNDKYFCEDYTEDYKECLPKYIIIDLIDDITSFLYRRYTKIEERIREANNTSFLYDSAEAILSTNSYLMKFNNIVDVISDILQENKDSFREIDVLNELNSYLDDFWIGDSKHSITISDGKLKAIDSNNQVDLENRGTGFQAFIYVFIKMIVSARLLSEDKGIILVEEPEKLLHPQAQRDFIKAVEELSDVYENCKFIITTHSPIIVNHSRRGSIFLLKKDKNGVTTIETRPYENNWKDLRGNLGVLPSDSLIFGKINLIVEGASEYLYIKHLLSKTGINLDLDNISVINAGGAANIEKLVKVTKGEQAILNKVIVLVDGDKEGRDAIRAIKRELLLEDKYLIQLDKNGRVDIDIAFEDIMPRELRLEALKKVYDLPELTQSEFDNFIIKEKIDNKLTWSKKAEKYLISINKITEESSIDKLNLIEYMVENINPEKIPEDIIKMAELLEKIQAEN